MDSRIHLVLVDKPETREFGDFSIIDGKAVRDENAADRSFVFTGVSYIQPEVFRGYTVTKFSLRDILFDEIEQGHVTGEYFDGVWFDVGSHEQLKRLRRYLM